MRVHTFAVANNNTTITGPRRRRDTERTEKLSVSRSFCGCVIVALLSTSSAPAGSVADPAPVTVGIEGRANQTPMLAARGSFVALAWSAGLPSSAASDVYVVVSRDGGASLGKAVAITGGSQDARVGGEQPPIVALVPGPGSDPDIVVLWRARSGVQTTLRLARSHDGGRSFEPPLLVSAAGAAGDRGWANLAVDAHGVVHVAWLDHRDLARAEGQHAHHTATAENGVAMAERSRLMYWSDADRRERTLATGVCYCCKTAVAIGARGQLYLSWRHVYAGNIRDIAFVASRDGGKTFEPQGRVNDDRWVLNGCPDDGPAMAVDEGGTIHVAWPTVIGGDAPRKRLRYARSADGRTFSAPVEIPGLGSTNPAHVQLAVAGDRLVFGWDELMDGRRQVATVAATRSGDRLSFDAPRRVDGGAAAGQYPVFARTTDGVVMAWTSGARERSRIAINRVR